MFFRWFGMIQIRLAQISSTNVSQLWYMMLQTWNRHKLVTTPIRFFHISSSITNRTYHHDDVGKDVTVHIDIRGYVPNGQQCLLEDTRRFFLFWNMYIGVFRFFSLNIVLNGSRMRKSGLNRWCIVVTPKVNPASSCARHVYRQDHIFTERNVNTHGHMERRTGNRLPIK